jgi:hypothetical protein
MFWWGARNLHVCNFHPGRGYFVEEYKVDHTESYRYVETQDEETPMLTKLRLARIAVFM